MLHHPGCRVNRSDFFRQPHLLSERHSGWRRCAPAARPVRQVTPPRC